MGAVTLNNGATVDTYYRTTGSGSNRKKTAYATYNGKASYDMTPEELQAAADATTGLSGEGRRAHDIFATGQDAGGAAYGEEYAAMFADQIKAANAYADKAAAQAVNIDPYAKKINAIGDNLSKYTKLYNKQAAALNPYISDFNRYAGTLWDQGTGMFDLGSNLSGQGRGLMNMDGSNDPNSLLGRYESWVRQLDPDRYVAMAAEDVQKSFDNTFQQQIRDMGRAGYDASSTKTAEFRQRMSQGLAAALAGAKFRARQQGLSDMGSALQSALGQAEQAISLGVDIQGAGANMQTAGAGLRGDAAKLEAQKASLYSAAASNEGNRASLYGSAAGLQATKAQIYNNAATAMLGGAQAAVTQQQVKFDYYYADMQYQLGQQQIKADRYASQTQLAGTVISSLAKIGGSAMGAGMLG